MNCVTNCTITIYGNELKYDGVQAPKYYYTRLFQPNRTISEGELTSIKVNLIHFTNLIKEYKYNYQIVLCVTDQKSECFNDDLTTFEFKTTCEELHNDQILIKSLNRRTTINVTSYNSNINCFLHEYSMLILDEANSTVQYSKHLGRSNTILSLNIFTNYTLQLTKTHEITHNIVFTTDESVPNRVRNLTIISSSTSKLRVVWEAPIPVTGIITNYVVTWMLVGKRSCKNGNKSASIQSKNLTSTVIELNDLAPYSIYNISVSAVTKKGRSDIHSILGYTDPITTTETMQLNKFNHKITSLKTSLQIDLVVDCENWNGPIYLNAYAICKSEWCEGQWINATKHMQFNDNATINNLLPFTDYKLDLYQSYKNGDIFDNIYKLLSIDVKTLRTVPNQIPFMEIYSLSEISLSLRWSAPYPPTGILDSFIIKYHYTSEGDSTSQTDINSLSPCKIWPNMYCTTLTNLTANKNYIISIAGRNQISEYGLETILNETTLIKTPQSPLNLVINWDEFRFLQLQWQHPNKTNGPLLSFEVIVNGQHYLYQGPENTTYTFNAQFQCNPEIRHANVSIQTVNSKFRSALLTRLFICPIFKPSLQFKPSAIHNSNKSITISIPAIENDEAISNLYIVLLVTESDNTRTGDCRAKLGNNHDSIISVRKNQICWIIGHYEQRDYKEIERMEMNINLTQIPEFNCTENSFEVNILIVNKLDDQMSSNWYLVNQRQLEDIKFSSILLSLIVLTLIIIIIISILGLFLWRKKRRQENKNKDCKIYVEVIIPLVPMKKTKSTKEKKAKCSRPVVVRDFHEYVRTLANKPEFAMEYNNIVALTKQWDINLHRVKTAAECLDASYISMIIDEKVENIVLFASMNDICNEKCEKYWPDYRLNKSVSYSDGCSKIKITTLPVKRLLSYDMHHFKIKQASTVVKTRFWHFTNCDKGGTLRHLDSFLSFLQGLQFIERSSQHPILVHSSCGLNASTDLFILLDICIRQAQKDEVVDICYQVQRLRTQRPNCIDTFEDYLFAHHILDKYFTMLPYTFADDHNSN
ncbi:phosphatidylinositol phosphatase PTPRQ-like [Atheta coriaria]|uniref:phosphatidylinositol phosphatase PTPRQ-like n=1 Tax=Dalotia coriaria TaxID=877792 RepID=UPI0031F3714E